MIFFTILSTDRTLDHKQRCVQSPEECIQYNYRLHSLKCIHLQDSYNTINTIHKLFIIPSSKYTSIERNLSLNKLNLTQTNTRIFFYKTNKIQHFPIHFTKAYIQTWGKKYCIISLIYCCFIREGNKYISNKYMFQRYTFMYFQNHIKQNYEVWKKYTLKDLYSVYFINFIK